MALDRWIALIILIICAAYGYTAFFTMDGGLPPFMQRNPIWPSTFPKVIAALAIIASVIILFRLEKGTGEEKAPEINYRRLTDYKLGQALFLLGLMVAYALLLRPAGFLLSTSVFLLAGFYTLGERKYHVMIPVALIATVGIWYLVQEVLGIFLSPWPSFMLGGA
ncbi:tripartite tricarboxylate transporter TctB family protein [Roseibium sediminis]|uniref:tripartite tricarboxylate transporter TctB family protein n=1 Tax=Roseibium sediminis TaxID=1775174 RepID=UPI00123CE39A|nr:tripartite tricarboxylate transporter TctB family protein [Roseibium sediminis]